MSVYLHKEKQDNLVNQKIFTHEKRLKAILWMIIGGMAVLAFSLLMNQFVTTPEPAKKEASASFEVQKVTKPKPKPKPKKKPKSKPKKSQKAPPPSIGSQLSGIDMGLNFDMGLNDTDDALLGNTSDVVMSADSVDTPPKATERAAMEYPKAALREKVSGYVVMNILVNKDGEVERVKILESVPEGVFDESARAGIGSWKFQPALYQGKKVNVWAKQKIRFSLD